MPILTLTAGPEQAGRTVRSLLKEELGLSTGCINRVKRQRGCLTLNGEDVFTNAVVAPGDVLQVDAAPAETPSGIVPIPMELSIVYEDQDLLILNKPAFLPVIPSSLRREEPSLANGVAAYLGPEACFHPVNRLDRGTTGLMAVAKSGYIHEKLQRSLHTGDFRRSYLALTVGTPEPRTGTVDLPIARAPGSAVQRRTDMEGQRAVTDYRVLREKGGLALVEAEPYTGRTHQIRVHMAAIGCPLAGDWLYGTEDPSLIGRPALHSFRLRVTHPVTGERLELTADLPEDMKNVLER